LRAYCVAARRCLRAACLYLCRAAARAGWRGDPAWRALLSAYRLLLLNWRDGARHSAWAACCAGAVGGWWRPSRCASSPPATCSQTPRCLCWRTLVLNTRAFCCYLLPSACACLPACLLWHLLNSVCFTVVPLYLSLLPLFSAYAHSATVPAAVQAFSGLRAGAAKVCASPLGAWWDSSFLWRMTFAKEERPAFRRLATPPAAYLPPACLHALPRNAQSGHRGACWRGRRVHYRRT